MIQGFDHVGICARDTKALKDWYCDLLGFTLFSDNGKGNYFVRAADGVMIEIMPQMADKDPDGEESAIGWKHIALVPVDFDSAVEKLLAYGVPVVSGPNKREDGYCTFFFRDPEGNIVHLAKR